jgi:hypothetical protein
MRQMAHLAAMACAFFQPDNLGPTWPHFINLLRASRDSFLLALGATGLGWWVQAIILFLVTEGATYFVVWCRRGKGAMKARASENILTGFYVWLIVLVFVYVPIFGWSVIRTVYHDHQALTESNGRLRAEVDRLKNKGVYETSFLNSYAYINTVQAFGYLRGFGGVAANPRSSCDVKITAPAENEAIRQALSQIASAFGCFLPTTGGTSDTNPDIRAEISTGAIPNVVVIYAGRENSGAAGFAGAMGNSFHIQRVYDLPPKSQPNLVWIQIGPGSVWRKDK